MDEKKSDVFFWRFFETESGQRPIDKRLYVFEEVVQFFVVFRGFYDVVYVLLDCDRMQMEPNSGFLPERDGVSVFVADAGDYGLDVLFHRSGHLVK